MFKKTQHTGRMAKVQKGFLGFLFGIMFLLPGVASAYDLTTGTGLTGNLINMSVGGGNTNGAQPVTTTGTSGFIETAQFCLGSASSPTGSVYLDVFADSGGAPTSTSLGQASVLASSVGANGLVTFTFSPWVPVSDSTTYHVSVSRSSYAVGTIYGCGGSAAPNDAVYSDDNGATWTGLSNQFYTVVTVTAATSSAASSTSVQVVDNPALNLFLGLVLFMLTFGFIVFYFRVR